MLFYLFQDLKKYLLANNGTSIWKEFVRSNTLKKPSRRELIRILHSAIVENFGSKPQQADIEKVCVSAVTLFPFLKVTPSCIGGIVSVVLYVHINVIESLNRILYIYRMRCTIRKTRLVSCTRELEINAKKRLQRLLQLKPRIHVYHMYCRTRTKNVT